MSKKKKQRNRIVSKQINEDVIETILQGSNAEALLNKRKVLSYSNGQYSITNDNKILSDALYYSGESSIKLGRYDEALELFKKSIECNPENLISWERMVGLYEKMECYDNALFVYDKIIEMNPNYAAPWNNKGNILQKRALYDEALEAYYKSIELDPNYAAPWSNIGDIYNKNGFYNKALEAYNKSIELDPNHAAPWNGNGNVYDNLSLYDEALKAYENSILLCSSLKQPWNGIGNVYKHLARYDEALEAYNKSIELDPYYAAPWNGKGNIFLKIARYDDALKAYDKCIELDPKASTPWHGKSITFKYQNNIIASLQCVQRSYYLATMEKSIDYKLLKSTLDLFIDGFGEKLWAPLFLYKVCIEHQIICSYTRYSQLIRDVWNGKHPVINLMQYLESQKNIEINAKILGLMCYYLGDPVKAADIFDSLDDSDLMAQYYYILSLNDYFQHIEGAYPSAEGALADQIGSDCAAVDANRHYYAGQVLLLLGKLNEALDCFNKSKEYFLPARYMAFQILHEKGMFEERDKEAIVILHEEEILLAEQKKGFVGLHSAIHVDNLDDGLDVPFLGYAHSQEIELARETLYNLIEEKPNLLQNKKRVSQLISDEKEIRPNEKNNLAGWVFSQKAKDKLQAWREKVKTEWLEYERKELIHFWGKSILETCCADAESMVADMVLTRNDILEKYSNYEQLSRYLFHAQKLLPHKAITLFMFMTYIKQIRKWETRERKILSTVGSLGSSLTVNAIIKLFNVQAYDMSLWLPLQLGSSGLSLIFGKYIDNCVYRYIENNEIIQYREFVKCFYDYADEMLGKDGEETLNEVLEKIFTPPDDNNDNRSSNRSD